MSANIVNFNKVRKARAKADDDRRAVENMAYFSRTKAERANDERERNTVNQALDGAQLDPARLDENHDDLDPGNVS
jgi:hypothetical protein